LAPWTEPFSHGLDDETDDGSKALLPIGELRQAIPAITQHMLTVQLRVPAKPSSRGRKAKGC